MRRLMSEYDIQIALSGIRLQLMAIATRHPEEIAAMVSIGEILGELERAYKSGASERVLEAERAPRGAGPQLAGSSRADQEAAEAGPARPEPKRPGALTRGAVEAMEEEAAARAGAEAERVEKEAEGEAVKEETPKKVPSVYGRQKLYYRVMSVRGRCLAEDWKEAKQPYYVPEPIYEGVAAVLAECARAEPVGFDRLVEELAKVQPGVSDYMLRTCLRFWRQSEPPLVDMMHRRYAAISPDTFRQDAMKLWDRTPELAG